MRRTTKVHYAKGWHPWLLSADEEIPDSFGPENMDTEARRIVEAMRDCLPGGVVDRVLAELLRRKASELVVPASLYDRRPRPGEFTNPNWTAAQTAGIVAETQTDLFAAALGHVLFRDHDYTDTCSGCQSAAKLLNDWKALRKPPEKERM
jgi:hypothetical protein